MRYVSSLHTYAYSVIALQQLNLAHRFPIIFWNTANLIVDSAGEDEEEEASELALADQSTITIDTNEAEEDLEDEEEEKTTTTKKKNKPVNYGKISSAIGKMQQKGIQIDLPDINKSKFTFIPDVERNVIVYGIKGITRVGDDLVHTIIENRPYSSLEDFLSKVKVNKLQAVNLIQAGCFDSLENAPREMVLRKYLGLVSDKKKDCNLRNMQMLINQNLIPEEHDFHKRLYNFNKYIKKFKVGASYMLDEVALGFFEKYYDVDLVDCVDGKMLINQKIWDKGYTKDMNPMREYLKANKQELLNKMNNNLTQELVDKYAAGNRSQWEISSLGFYHSEHELAHVNREEYDIRNFFDEPEEPKVQTTFFPKGRDKPVPLYELYRICGTVIEKDKTKRMITLLTPEGVVHIRIWQAQFTKYDKQISEKLPSGKKKVIEKSWFSRGNKLLVTGFRREDNFVPKVYAKSKYQHPFEKIESIEEDGSLVTVVGRED